MSFSSLRKRARACVGFRSLAAGILLWPAAALAAPPNDVIGVNVDQATLFKIPGKVATIVVGNPMIADVTLQPGGIVVSPARAMAPPISSPWTAAARSWSTA